VDQREGVDFDLDPDSDPDLEPTIMILPPFPGVAVRGSVAPV